MATADLIDALASDAPAPASGSAAAAVVAAAAALLQKVAQRSGSRWPRASEANRLAEALRLRAQELVELDSLAYLGFIDAVRSGKGVEEARRRTIEVPREIARVAADVIGLAYEAEYNGNPNLAPDALAAAMLADAAARTARQSQ